jgi:hypothetical protein
MFFMGKKQGDSIIEGKECKEYIEPKEDSACIQIARKGYQCASYR